MLLVAYARSTFHDFESYLRIVVGLDEDDTQLILNQCNSNLITYESSPGIYSIKDVPDVVYSIEDHEGTLQIENNNINMKRKPTLGRFGETFGTLRFNEKSFFYTLLGFTPHRDYKPTNTIHADSPGVYTSDKILNLSTKDKFHLKCHVIDGSILDGVRQPNYYIFTLNKPAGYKVFCEPESVP